MTPATATTLAMVADAMTDTCEPWWVIGSADVALHGRPVAVGDVDVLAGVVDARALLARLGLDALRGTPDPRFASAVFGRWRTPPLTVEVMAGFRVRTAPGWTAVWPATREPVRVGTATLDVPSAAELRTMLLSFGRDKDLARIALLPG